MFDSIRRHQKWLWVIIITLTIISFVVFFSPNQQMGMGGGGARGNETVGSINGRPIQSEEYLDILRETHLRYYLSYRDWPRNDEFSRQLLAGEVRNRLVLLEKFQQYGVKVSDAATAQWIAEVFRDPQRGTFRRDSFDEFVRGDLARQGLTRGDFERFARHEVGIQHLLSVAGLSGKLVPPQEAETIYRRQNEQVDTQVVFLSASNYLAQVEMDPAAIATFYTNRQANYRMPERVQVSYVKFDVTNFVAEAEQVLALSTNLPQVIDMVYQQRGTNYVGTNNLPLPPAEAKERIRSDIAGEQALIEARKKAIDFANKLIELPPQTNNLQNLAAAEGLEAAVTEPFSASEGPSGLAVPNTFIQAAFQLTPEEPVYEQPIVAKDGVYLIGFYARFPSEPQPLESVQERVIEEYRSSKASELVRIVGEELHRNMTNGLGQGKSFPELATEAQLTVVDLPPFSKQTAVLPEISGRNLTALKNAAFSISPGQVSEFTPTLDGGLIVFAQARVPVADSQLQQELPNFLKDLRRSRQYEAFGDWLRKEVELARVSLPGDSRERTN